MTPPHDVVRDTSLSHGGWQIECRCGRLFTATSELLAHEKHRKHFDLVTHMPGLRASLRGEGE